MKLRILTLAAVSAFAVAGPAFAQDDESGFGVEVELAMVSDYRYRGYSLSDEEPALQGGVTASLPGGVYAGAWASTIAEYGGADTEVDLFAGVAFTTGGLDWDLSVIRYAYPGGQDVDYWEIPVAVSKSWGDFTATATFAYAPEQDNLPEDNRYVGLAGEWGAESWPVTLTAGIGYEDGAFGDGKTDWSLGLAKSFGPVTYSLGWHDTDAPDVDGGMVVGLSAAF